MLRNGEWVADWQPVQAKDDKGGFLFGDQSMERAYRITLESHATAPVAVEVRDSIPVSKVEDIEVDLQQKGHMEVHTSALGAMVMERLRELDRVAYIRYASVYRAFQDIESFEEVVRDLRDESQLPLLNMPPALPKKERRRPVEPEAEFLPGKKKGSTDKDKNGQETVGPQQGLINQD